MNYEILILLFIVTCLREGMGLRCYQCNSARDPNCGDPFSNSTVADVDCEQLLPGRNATVCRKNVQKVNLGGKSDFRVVRACGWEGEKKASARDVAADDDSIVLGPGGSKCYTRAGTFEVMVTYCTCSTPQCNGSEKMMPGHLIAMSMTALATSAILFMSTMLVRN